MKQINIHWPKILFPKTSKSYLTVKEGQFSYVTALFDNPNINVTVEGKKHVGAIVGSKGYKREFADELVKDWNISYACCQP